MGLEIYQERGLDKKGGGQRGTLKETMHITSQLSYNFGEVLLDCHNSENLIPK